MTTTPTSPPGVAGTDFERRLVAAGTDAAVAAELERRIEIIEQQERDDASRRPMSGAEIAGYVAATVAAVVLGIGVVLL